MVKPLQAKPKSKRRSSTHVAGGQLSDDVLELPKAITEKVVNEIFRKVISANLEKTRNSSAPPQLRDELIRCVGWYRCARNVQRRPSKSEILERLLSVEGHLERLWTAFGLPKTLQQFLEGGILPHEVVISPTLRDILRPIVDEWGSKYDSDKRQQTTFPGSYSTDVGLLELALAKQTDPKVAMSTTSMYPDIKLFEEFQSLALLATWVKEAKSKLTIVNRRSRTIDWPLYRVTFELSNLFSDTFQSRPKETSGGPWLTFLQEALTLSGDQPRSDEALRQLWRKTKTAASQR